MAGPRPGEVLNDRYELIDRIGGGSMGEVWRGRDLVLGRTVAVKIVLPALLDAPTFRARFVAEARVMAMMDHPGIVGVYDYGYADGADPDTPGAAFLVMEFIEGESLDRVLARTGPLEPRFAMKVLASLLDALAAVHRTGVVHRDVKPANVMLTAGGVVLADFGIARSPESLGLTAADALMGTVPYLAPELFHAEAPTPGADVYAVGILGYELLSGRQPFQAASTAAVMYMHMHEPPPPLPDYVSAPVVEVLWHALEKDPAHRWADGAEMAEALRHVLAGPVEAGEDVGAGGMHAGYSGTPSGYEDTLTDSGGRRRRRPGAEAGYAAAGAAGAAAAAAGGYEDGLYGDAGPAGRYGRDAAFGENAASGFGSGYGHDEYENGYPASSASYTEAGGRHGRVSPLEETAPLSALPGAISGAAPGAIPGAAPGGLPGATARLPYPADFPADGTRVYEEIPASLGDSGGRHGHAAVPDGTRVYDALPASLADSGGRRAGSGYEPDGYDPEEPPIRRRGAAEPYAGGTTGLGGRGGGLRGGLRPEVRRKAFITAAVAVPAVLGLSVALAMSSSGKSPDGGQPAPGTAQQTDAPTATGTEDTVPPTEPVPTSTSTYEHTYSHHSPSSYPSYTHSSAAGTSSSSTDPTTSSRSDQPTDTSTTSSSSSSGLPSSTDSSTQGASSPSSPPASHPTSSHS
ncbi:serine/threonine protein kinase [Catenulispora sp. NF23]|uniref:serine/threonine-protein kinase n=1 Tax=Catenulispora pinistramenti TaxID=2705254 RepID=UPI001BA50FDD|nr:serine/threonine-protein kinase [Catenulispora pinistramenti]MBS2538947.1 serine/threonine protein kinase [Catenulispora pinistramenti]